MATATSSTSTCWWWAPGCRHRRRPLPAGRVPLGVLRHLRGPRRHRRHLGPVPLPRHPLRLGHVHAGLLVPALGPGHGHRRRPVDPGLHPRDRGGRGHRRATSASATASCRPSGRPPRPAGTSPPSAPPPRPTATARRGRRRDRAAHLQLPVLVQRLLPLRPGYLPDFPGTERFGGTIVHPQFWPDDLDYAGKQVVVIGSGATAVTLIPPWPAPPATSRCCSGRPATSPRCRPRTRSPTSPAAATRPGVGSPGAVVQGT